MLLLYYLSAELRYVTVEYNKSLVSAVRRHLSVTPGWLCTVFANFWVSLQGTDPASDA